MLKKIAILFFSIVLYSTSGNSQHSMDYKKMLEKATSGPEKLIILDSLLRQTYTTDPDAFIDYSFEYIELAQDLDSIESAAKKAMNLQHPLTTYANDPLRAITVINSVLARKYLIKDSLYLGGLYLKRGKANAKVNLQKAVDDYTIALENFAADDVLHKADVHLFRGQAYSNMGKFVLAGQDYSTAYRLYESKEEYTYMVYAQQGIINMFSMNGFYEKARHERQQLIETMKKLHLDSYLANEYYNQAIDYKKMDKRRLEYKELLKAEEAYDNANGSKSTFIAIHSMLISYYCDNAQFDEAKKHLDLLEALPSEVYGDPLSQMNYLSGKVEYLNAIGEFEQSLVLAKKKLAIAEQLGVEDEIMATHNLLSDIYYHTGNLEQSLASAKKAWAIKDAIYNKSTANALAYYQTLYETEKRQKELVEKNTSIRLLEKDNQGFKKAILFGSIAILLLFGVILLYRNQRHLKSHKLLQERFSQELLISQEGERRRISKDLHDGIGQQLLVIKNRLMLSGDAETKKMVDYTIEEVRSISRDLHPFQLQEMGITKAIENTINQIDENTTLFISAEIDNIDDVFSKEDEVNIYRIIQESLSNILKHAHAEAGKVSVKKFAGNILISIRDNGIGFDFAEKYQDVKSLGLKTLLERTKFLKGQMKVTSKKNNGTLIEFQFPI